MALNAVFWWPIAVLHSVCRFLSILLSSCQIKPCILQPDGHLDSCKDHEVYLFLSHAYRFMTLPSLYYGGSEEVVSIMLLTKSSSEHRSRLESSQQRCFLYVWERLKVWGPSSLCRSNLTHTADIKTRIPEIRPASKPWCGTFLIEMK